MNATQKTTLVQTRLERRGIVLAFGDVETLRRAEMTLHRWAELECGDGDAYKSWAIERDDLNAKPFMVYYFHDGKTRRYTIPDREAGALKRVRKVCESNGLHFYHQTDPRGCQLYVSTEPLDDRTYTNGVAVCN